MKPIYLDHHATTPVDPRVLEVMLPWFTENFGNPGSIDHLHGLEAKQAVDLAREQVAKSIGAKKSSEIIFTSGATESNNLAIIGTWRKRKDKGKHILISAIEHACVHETAAWLASEEGADVETIPVDHLGRVSVEDVKQRLRDDTILVSIMWANNEIGTIQDIKEIGTIVRKHGAVFHTDAAQAAGHLDIKVYRDEVDLLSISGHKIYGPKGIGALYVRSTAPAIRLGRIIHGGDQERSMRSGTLNVPGIVGLGAALELAVKLRKEENDKNFKLANEIEQALRKVYPNLKRNGDPDHRLPHNLSLTIPGVEAKALIHKLKGELSFSAGSACSTTKILPSHVLKAIGLSDDECFQSIRIGLGRLSRHETNIPNVICDKARNS